MANISFKQNILPKTDNTYYLGNSSYKWHAYLATINGQPISSLFLPAVTSSDNGKVLKVSDGQWTAGTIDISGKADKVANATNGNVATLDANGNLTDSGKTLGKSVPSDAKFTDTTYSAATQSVAGLMSATDKTKLDGIATGATANVVSDSLSDTSTTNALSAAKGKALNDSISTLNSKMVNVYHFADNTGFEYDSTYKFWRIYIGSLPFYNKHIICGQTKADGLNSVVCNQRYGQDYLYVMIRNAITNDPIETFPPYGLDIYWMP